MAYKNESKSNNWCNFNYSEIHDDRKKQSDVQR